ncbi:MAG: exopolysaccharide biosynthesis protein [Parachlamydiales bacterium]|jgi:hypothetical protein
MNEKVKTPHPTFLQSLQTLLTLTKETKEIRLQQMFAILSGKGYAALLILISFPFCLPIQIPGFSLFFGALLAFIGLRLAFGKHPWWPKWMLNKTVKSKNLETAVEKTIHAVIYCKKILKPRFTFLARNPLLHRMHGIVILILSLLLAIPIPLPFTNMVVAIPILFFGLGLLEEDGIFIFIAYMLSFLGIGLFFGIFWYSKGHLERILS